MNTFTEDRKRTSDAPRRTSREWRKASGSFQAAVAVEGVAAAQNFGPQIGLYDLYSSESAFMFCMSLPGVDLDKDTFKCEVKRTGEITISGEVTAGVFKPFENLKVVVNNLPDSGPFSVKIRLPERVNERTLQLSSANDGILWGLIKKEFAAEAKVEVIKKEFAAEPKVEVIKKEFDAEAKVEVIKKEFAAESKVEVIKKEFEPKVEVIKKEFASEPKAEVIKQEFAEPKVEVIVKEEYIFI